MGGPPAGETGMGSVAGRFVFSFERTVTGVAGRLGFGAAGFYGDGFGGLHLPTIERAITMRWICCVPS